jgi:type I restriction enzyme, R subunit
MEIWWKKMDELEQIKQSIIEEVNSLPKDSEGIIPHLDDIEKVLNPNFWNTRGQDPLDFIRKRILPLMRYKQDVQPKPSSFVLKCEQLLLSKLMWGDSSEWWKQEGPEKLIDDICESLTKIPQNIDAVLEKKELIKSALDTKSKFWDDITSEKIFQIRDELSPLMIYQQSEPVKTILIKMDDVIQERGRVRFGPELTSIDSQAYVEKVEKKIRELAESNPVILKIKNNEEITENDIELLADTLTSTELGITSETLSKAYNTPKKDIVEFIRHILGLTKLPNKDDMIEEAFSGFLLTKNFNADQINFIRILESVFISKKSIAFRDFYDPPFSNMGKPLTSYFEKEELLELEKFCKTLEKQVSK